MLTFNGTAQTASSLFGAVGSTFSFAINPTVSEVSNEANGVRDFYIDSLTVSTVPVPGGILLLGTALGGFGFLRFRRRP